MAMSPLVVLAPPLSMENFSMVWAWVCKQVKPMINDSMVFILCVFIVLCHCETFRSWQSFLLNRLLRRSCLTPHNDDSSLRVKRSSLLVWYSYFTDCFSQ